jgi:hypothetical protein
MELFVEQAKDDIECVLKKLIELTTIRNAETMIIRNIFTINTRGLVLVRDDDIAYARAALPTENGKISTRLQYRYGGPYTVIWRRGTTVWFSLAKQLP